MHCMMMPAAEWDRELIADLAAERTGLGKSEVVGGPRACGRTRDTPVGRHSEGARGCDSDSGPRPSAGTHINNWRPTLTLSCLPERLGLRLITLNDADAITKPSLSWIVFDRALYAAYHERAVWETTNSIGAEEV